ncbi:MAG TPA: hypothetical protein VLX28_01935, partial [Thermoanaerobaculia bacterium]|nr:hypothetical protein [Thermoanaerobaculia bacterium]
AEPGALEDFLRTIFPDEPLTRSSREIMEDQLLRLVRRALESDEFTMSRGAEILGISLSEMRDLSATWLDTWDARPAPSSDRTAE